MSNTGDMYTKSHIKVEGKRPYDGLYTIPDCIKYYADILDQKEAFVFADYDGGRQAVTWIELYEKSISVARSLIRLGVRKGELVAINARSCPEWLYFVFGSMFAGAVPVCISFTSRDGNDFIALMKTMKTCCLIALDPGTDGGNWRVIKNLLDGYSPDGKASSRNMPSLRYIIGLEIGASEETIGVKSIRELIIDSNFDVTLPDLAEDEMVLIFQTSGSTGVPKLAVHTQKSLVTDRQTNTAGYRDPSLIHYNVCSFSWIGGFPLSVVYGQKRVMVSGLSSQPCNRMCKMLEIIQRERCTLLTASPSMVYTLIQSQIPTDWPVKGLSTGGEPLTEDITAAIGKVATYMAVSYGSTELGDITSSLILEGEKVRNCFCGEILKIPGMEVKVVGGNGDTVPVNTRGEVYVLTPGVFKEYYNEPEKTAAVFTRGGWFKTGDIGLMTENGELFIYGRKSHMIDCGGTNVLPEILEHEIKRCPGVASIVIVPVLDGFYYQVLCACVIRQTGSDLTEEQLRKFCEEINNDSPRQFTVLPKYYMFLEDFPETSSGKTNRIKLTKRAAKTFGTPPAEEN